MRRRVITTVVAVVALAIGLGAGAAYAYWTSGGSGSGSASTATVQGVTILSASAVPSTKLIPGATAELVVEVANPNDYELTVTSLSSGGAVSVVNGAGCTGSNAGVSVVAQPNLATTLGPGPNVLRLADAVAMSISSDTMCQGASFRIPVTMTVQR